MSASEGGNLGEEECARRGRTTAAALWWKCSTCWVQGTHRRLHSPQRMQQRFRGPSRSSGGTTQQDLEKVAIRRWTSDASTVTKTNRALQTRPTVEALRSSLLPYNRRRREGAAEAGAESGARGGGRRSPGRALKQARAVKTGQVQRHAQVAAGTREGGGGSAVRYANPRGLHRQVRSRI